VRRLEDAGASAVVLNSLFEEQIEIESEELNRFLFESSGSSAEAGTELPELNAPRAEGGDYLKHIQAARRRPDPRDRHLNGSSKGGWLTTRANGGRPSADRLEAEHLQYPSIRRSRRAGRAAYIDPSPGRSEHVKLRWRSSWPEFQLPCHMARSWERRGVNGNGLFTVSTSRFDLEAMKWFNLSSATPTRLLLRLNWIAVLYAR